MLKLESQGGMNSSASQPPKIRGASLIIEEQPIMVLRSLAAMIGLEESIVVQQMYWLLRDERNGKDLNGHRWLFNTYDQWHAFFPFWSTRTIRRIFDQLETMHLVESCQPEGVRSRRKWYRLNVGMIQKLKENPDVANLAASKSPIRPVPVTRESLQEGLKESEDVISGGDEGVKEKFPALGAWDKRTKQEKLDGMNVRRVPVSEQGFDAFIYDNDLRGIDDYAPDLYHRLCRWKWHRWDEDNGKWRPIRNWKEFALGLNDHLIRTKNRK